MTEKSLWTLRQKGIHCRKFHYKISGRAAQIVPRLDDQERVIGHCRSASPGKLVHLPQSGGGGCKKGIKDLHWSVDFRTPRCGWVQRVHVATAS